MLDLIKAIALATEAHKGQWRKAEPLDLSTHFYNLKDYPEYTKQAFFINEDGFKISMDNTGWIIQEPYINHPLAVMNMMTTEEEKTVAVLHDVFEDSKDLYINFDSIDSKIMYNDNEYFIPIDLAEALNHLTKANGVSYTAYIEDICSWTLVSGNKLAAKVKLADIIHNLTGNPSEHARQKYMKAIPLLLNSL